MTAMTKDAKVESASRTEIIDAVEKWCRANGKVGDMESELRRVEQWRDASASVVAKVASVLAGRSIDTRWTMSVPIAATDGEDILVSPRWFADNIVPSLLQRDASASILHWADLKAVAYHELSHIMWTPRPTHLPLKTIVALDDTAERDSLLRWWNLLEDQRIESLFVARYRPAGTLFTGMVLRHVVSTRGAEDLTHLWVHGRKYLPSNIRSAYRQAFASEWGEALTAQFDSLIDRYRKFVFPTDSEESIELIREFARLVELIEGRQIPLRAKADQWENSHGLHKTGRPVPVADSRKARDQMVEEDKLDESGGDTKVGAGTSGSSDDSVEESSAGSGSTPGTSDSDSESHFEDICDMVEEALEEVESVEAHEGAEMLKAVAASAAESQAASIPRIPNTWGRLTRPIRPWMTVAANSLRNELMQLTTDQTENWDRGHTSGRLNVRDAMDARGMHCNIFDAWSDIDEDEMSFEVSVLIDRSGSMEGSRQHVASQALWVVRRALDQLDIPVTVYGYDHESRLEASPALLASATEYDFYKSGGSTNPYQALLWTRELMKSTRAANKLLVSITDGQWYCRRGSYNWHAMNGIRAAGVDTLLVLIDMDARDVDRDGGRWNGHDSVVSLTTNSLARLPVEIGGQVARMINDRLSQMTV